MYSSPANVPWTHLLLTSCSSPAHPCLFTIYSHFLISCSPTTHLQLTSCPSSLHSPGANPCSSPVHLLIITPSPPVNLRFPTPTHFRLILVRLQLNSCSEHHHNRLSSCLFSCSSPVHVMLNICSPPAHLLLTSSKARPPYFFLMFSAPIRMTYLVISVPPSSTGSFQATLQLSWKTSDTLQNCGGSGLSTDRDRLQIQYNYITKL
jgi:hypothetical protein